MKNIFVLFAGLTILFSAIKTFLQLEALSISILVALRPTGSEGIPSQISAVQNDQSEN